ncbi:MAG TPA: hypothetical protein VHB48_07835 [Chitinophagaceae bacterium]|nr:hypothetical protein [Chitinophagaceae bacterium]
MEKDKGNQERCTKRGLANVRQSKLLGGVNSGLFNPQMQHCCLATYTATGFNQAAVFPTPEICYTIEAIITLPDTTATQKGVAVLAMAFKLKGAG